MAQFFNFKQDYYGLTESEVENNIALYGFNTYTKKEKTNIHYSPVKTLLSPSFILMFIAGILCFFGLGVGTGIAVLIIDAAYAAAEIYFGIKSDEKLAELNETTAMKFRVIRGGKPELIEKEFIVPEDTIVVQAGERVPADAFILESRDLTVDESVFTGSNKPVSKFAGAIAKNELKPSFVYSGSTVLTGIAVCRVSATGVDTKFFQKIGEQPDTHAYYTKLESVVIRVVPLCCAVAAVIALLTTVIGIFSGDSRDIGSSAVYAAIRGITLGLCFIPTGIAAIIRMYYTHGISSLIRSGAVVKSLSDIEKLNSLSVLCVEKEGAISKNRLEVRGFYARSEELLYKVAALSFDPNTSDQAEQALMVKASFFDENITDIYNDNKLIEKIPENNEVMRGALWNVGGDRLYCINGTPEQILPLCRLNGDALYAAQKKYNHYYSQGCSVLAFACADASQGDMDATAGFCYTFVGFAAFAAPLRESVSAAVKTCQRSGVRVVMLTEDNPGTAESTGKMIGLSGKKAVTGKQVSESVKYGTELDLDADVFAKLTPEQKLYIINKLKAHGDVVAMIGTRPTDADALELADVGITISQNSCGSTYEAADIIMNDDNFSSVADTIAAARQIHRNIKRAASVVISGIIGLILMNILNLFGGSELMLNPTVLALISMVILPFAALEYLNCKSDMKSVMPPSDFVTSSKINLKFVGQAAMFGAFSGAVAIASYLFMYNGANNDYARSCSLISFALCTAAFCVFRMSSSNPFSSFASSGKPAYIGAAVTVFLPILLVCIPGLNSAFGLALIDPLAFFICVLTGLLPAIAYFFIRHFIRFK